jgi:hypothetical protein
MLPLEYETATPKKLKERALQLKAAWTRHEQLPSSQYEISTCLFCFGTCYMNRRESRMYCSRCATSNRFISTLFLKRDHEREDNHTSTTHHTSTTVMNTMKKFGEQWSTNFTPFSTDVLEFMYQQYRIYSHTSDPSRVQTSRTLKLIEQQRDVLKTRVKSLRSLINSTDRLTKELRGDGIPEFQPKDLNLIYHVRKSLGSLDNEDDKEGKKTLSNAFFFRQIARIHGLNQGRLFPHVKTKNVFIKHSRILEKALMDYDGGSSNIKWQMFPCT